MIDSKSSKSIVKILGSLLFISFISSCKVATPPPLPNETAIPASYTGSSDTASMGDVPWREFFTDPYLEELIEEALENNLDLLTAIQRVEMARANYRLVGGALLPEVQGVAVADIASLSNDLVRAAFREEEGGRALQQDYFVGLQSSWEADLWGRLKNRKKAAYARFLASEKGRQLVITSLISEVSRVYYELLAVDNELEVVRKNINFQEIALEVVKIQKMGGRATELAVQQFTAQVLNTKALEGQMQQRIIDLENQLNLLLGRFPQAIPRGKDISEQKLPESIQAGIPSSLLLRRPDIQQAEFELTATKADLEAARAAFLPRLTISPYIGLNAIKSSLLFQTPESLAMGVLGGLTAPIFNRRQIRSDFDRSVAERMEAYYNYQESILSGYGEVVTYLREIENLQKVYNYKEEEVNVLLNAVSTSNDMFASGYATYLEVITAQASVLEAELQLANIKKRIFLSTIGLYRSLGGGWE